MSGEERREEIIRILNHSDTAVPGVKLADLLHVTRQVIVQDIALLRSRHIDIVSTSRGYVIEKQNSCSRILKVLHDNQEVEQEMNTVVDMGGWIRDVFVFHKVYGILRADLNVHSRREVAAYMKEIKTGKSTLLMNVTSGYHYHTIVADSEEILDLIQEELSRLGFLAKLQEYEPVDFWKKAEER